MSYQFLYTQQALDDLERMPSDLRSFVEARLAELARDPLGNYRKSTFPFPPGHCLFHCSREALTAADPEYKVNVFFHFHQDESHLNILMIGWYPVQRI